MAKKSTDEEALALDLRAEKLEGWEREYRFGAMAAGGPGKGLRAGWPRPD